MALSVVLGENGSVLKLGDKSFILSPLTLGDIAQAEEKFGTDLEGFEKSLKKIGNLLFLIYLALKRKQPEVKFEQIGDMFQISDMSELNQILSTILNISGMAAPKNA